MMREENATEKVEMTKVEREIEVEWGLRDGDINIIQRTLNVASVSRKGNQILEKCAIAVTRRPTLVSNLP